MTATARLAGRVALVTGAASGIGAATAAMMEGEGAIVWRADIKPDTGRDWVALDVASKASWDTAIAHIAATGKDVDILVNAAGISRTEGDQDISSVAVEDWRRVFAVNVEGTLLGCQYAMRAMKQGAIVNVASSAGVSPSPVLGPYGASKAAVVQLTRSIAAACAQKGLAIRCNAVAPGMAQTPMTEGMTAEYRARWIEQIPAGRFGAPEEVASAIVFLASDAASYINGAVLPVDGGLLNRPVIAALR